MHVYLYGSRDWFQWRRLRKEPINRERNPQRLRFLQLRLLVPDGGTLRLLLPLHGRAAHRLFSGRTPIHSASHLRDLIHWSEPKAMTYSDTGTATPPITCTPTTRSPIFEPPISTRVWPPFHEGPARRHRRPTGPDARGFARGPRLLRGLFRRGTLNDPARDHPVRPDLPGGPGTAGAGTGELGFPTNYPLRGVVQTGPAEMSFFVSRHYAQPSWHIERLTLRPGWIQLRPGSLRGRRDAHQTPDLLGKPAGDQLRHQRRRSLRVEIQDIEGKPFPGFSLSRVPGDHRGRDRTSGHVGRVART